MAHLVETMAYAGELPWHGLGHKVPNDLSTDQMMVAAGLDWTVDRIPAYAEINGVKTDIAKDALVRSSDNSVLDVIPRDWNPVQNQEAFDFFKEFIEAGDMQMHTAGSLKNGKLVWALAKVDDSFTLFGGDKVDSYMLFTNPHMYGKAIDIRFTPIRVVCNNTLTLSLGERVSKSLSINHRTVFNPEQAKLALDIAHSKMNRYSEMAKELGNKEFTVDTSKAYFDTLFPSDNNELSRNALKALQIMHTQPGAEFAKGSYWQLFNTVTYMTDHVLGRNNDTRLQSAWFGTNKSLKTNALELALAA